MSSTLNIPNVRLQPASANGLVRPACKVSKPNFRKLYALLTLVLSTALILSGSLSAIAWKSLQKKAVKLPDKAIQIIGNSDVLTVDTPIFESFLDDPAYKDSQEKLLALVQQNATTWEAALNPFASPIPPNKYRLADEASKESPVLRLARYWLNESYVLATIRHQETLFQALKDDVTEIPTKFDSRTRWPFCHSLFHIRDQAGCGSCWAHAVVSAVSDKYCIKSNGARQPMLSVDDLLNCCYNCRGCEGSDTLLQPLLYWLGNGVVTGGDYGSFHGCKPYPYPPICGAPCPTSNLMYAALTKPSCQKRCTSPLYNKTYTEDIHKGSEVYGVGHSLNLNALYSFKENLTPEKMKFMMRSSDARALAERLQALKSLPVPIFPGVENRTNEKMIMLEIMTNGPVITCFEAREDFQLYVKGIYDYIAGNALYAHCVKLVGWGEDNGTPFWTVANSWGTHWGENGFFRILRGRNVNKIETDVYAVSVNLTIKSGVYDSRRKTAVLAHFFGAIFLSISHKKLKKLFVREQNLQAYGDL